MDLGRGGKGCFWTQGEAKGEDKNSISKEHEELLLGNARDRSEKKKISTKVFRKGVRRNR